MGVSLPKLDKRLINLIENSPELKEDLKYDIIHSSCTTLRSIIGRNFEYFIELPEFKDYNTELKKAHNNVMMMTGLIL